MKNLFKTIFCLLAIISVSNTAKAQNAPMATLRHGTDYSYFYGADAFYDAEAAAVSGDEILLSAGVFNKANISLKKNLTIRGAGAETTDANEATFMSGSVDWSVDSIYVEGIHFLDGFSYYATGSSFVKCKFGDNFTGYTYRYTDNGHYLSMYSNAFINCWFKSLGVIESSKDNAFYNCIIKRQGTNCQSSFYYNCIILEGGMHGTFNAFYDNCIFTTGYVGDDYSYNSFQINQCRNCLMIIPTSGRTTNPFTGSLSDTNKFVNTDDFASYFKTFDISNGTDSEDFYELTDDKKTELVGTDGTQIGINGGYYPFSYKVTGAHILKKTIESVAKDGKLHVSLKLGFGEVLPATPSTGSDE